MASLAPVDRQPGCAAYQVLWWLMELVLLHCVYLIWCLIWLLA